MEFVGKKYDFELFINSKDEMIELGKMVGEASYPNLLITLNGDLGAGKTTFTKGIALGLDIKSIVSSPTFTIMKIYEGRLTLYHMDVYRINNPFSDFELEEYFELDGVCVIEWAENIKELLPDEYLSLFIEDLGDDKRRILIKGYGDKAKELINKLRRN
ncbi:MAG: tRNA (adenosine(37)-N6)-threonylcarbamoyltransferase complex ATPase subunit type 1 TsaE [Bacilli bacterium]|nr:tRNA (adenosine(37)-N6)-threonylcarbamoyltransferase complex ATPase subunit type 1 TsaE [Bacilli bacterium]